ncbi:U-box domain-containing protein 43-like [Andrographis paniculata]|uniref:U-box domain-containing protein 43-like n=1 Tax=Andrographis paniculata TaxID=175694 RepID=UPI0021E8996F|nr:U-box domain-containing protein 43-like [Andrographis paniculata]XP_051129859.1 U-box domain-containing protein 43-like [Andrographis paniculata]XP_051129861.1 U-box domain-containing protein 43-like [Andrographis paniculata]XP_051129862.1 U-box domain-containing protein 43-like [Andrographis paniculata]
MTDLVPIGTILAVLTKQIIKTAQAAKDVVFEKESFKVLGEHLHDIEPVLKELQSQQLSDSPATRQALESLETNVKKANNLVEKYKGRARFYLLVKCRHIVKEIQEVTREIGNSLAEFSFANVEVLSGISDQVNRLQNEMQRAELEAAQSRLQIVDKLNQGLSDQVFDKDFANDMLKQIARAVGIPVEPTSISRELANFKKEKEEAEIRKEQAEVLFLEQVIELLSRADAARDYEELRKQYFQRLKVVETYPGEECIKPFKPFFCCITGQVMIDPVSLCTGTTCEREAIKTWFKCGKTTDPETFEVLQDFSYRPNIQLRQSIQEWRELNYCVKIRSCMTRLLLDIDSSVEEALDDMRELVSDNSINKDWISIGGLTDVAVTTLDGRVTESVQKKLLATLKDIIEGHTRNKDIFIENQGIERILPFLAMDSIISKTAIELLHEVLLDTSGWNTRYCQMLSLHSNAIPLLVSLLKIPENETARIAEEILVKLCETDDNIICAAKANWFAPLISKMIKGSVPVRISMVRELVGMELDEEKIKLLGEEGIIPLLIEMASEKKIESKDMSLQALVKLSAFPPNKHLIAAAAGVPLILKLLFSSHMIAVVVAKCAEIIANLSSNGDGTKFLVDESGILLDLEPVTAGLLAFQQNINSLDVVRKPALRALLGICQSEAALVKSAVLSASGVPVVLGLLDDANQEIRELAVNLLFLFSQHEPEGVVEYLLKPRRLEALVGFLESCDKNKVQMAAAGLLANLPKSKTLLTTKLIELGGLQAILDIIKSGSIEAKENALSALFRFTDPTNLESQRNVVELGAYPLLADLLKSDSVTTSARAAALLGDLSMRTQELSVMSPRRMGCIFIPRARVMVCPAHGGNCSVKTTFCLLEGNVVPDLVKLLQAKVHATAYEAIQTLSTLVQEDSPYRGAAVLHDHGAIGPTIDVLRWGSESLKGEALGLLEKIFKSTEMVDSYGSMARLPLVNLTGRRISEYGHLQRKAARVLLLIERHSRSSMSLDDAGS